MKALSFKLPAAALLLVSTAFASAQRETFDASSITQRLDVLVVQGNTGAPSLKRSGHGVEGGRHNLIASVASASFSDIFFRFDSDKLRDGASAMKVDEIAQVLNSPRHRASRFLIEGHTCDLGDSAHNDKLSAKRADAIMKMLIKRGVAKERLVALGFGETEIVDPVTGRELASEAETKRMKSRRVVLRQILPSAAKK
jgi:outer membrane protein OmpA-like peptidoglycan-associated protein